MARIGIKNRLTNLVGRILRLTMRIPLALRIACFVGENAKAVTKSQAKKKVSKKISSTEPMKVLYGPFKGLIYPALDWVGSVSLPRILGTYESELHDVLEQICKTRYETIINIGAGEGYYTIGLAKRIPTAHVFAFETDPKGQILCIEMSKANHVNKRITVSGACDLDKLSQLVNGKQGGLVFCDCEGCEFELLRPDRLPKLEYFDLLVELHDYRDVGPIVTQVFNSRFSGTHCVEMINLRYLKPLAHLDLEDLSLLEQRAVALEERKYSVGWVFLRRRGSRLSSP